MLTGIKKISLLFSLLVIYLVPYAQEKQEQAAPLQFVSSMEALEAPSIADTALVNVVLTFRKSTYSISTFELSKKFPDSLSGFSSEDIKKLNTLINAKSSSDYKVLELINRFRDTAIYLCKLDFAFTDANPVQHKIAYSWGSKDYERRQIPPGADDNCIYSIHGLDCSGFIYQLFRSNLIGLPKAQCNADMERQPQFLKRHLKAFFGDLAFDVQDLGAIALTEIQSGDIIYFKNNAGTVYHIGIFFVNTNGQVSLYQSLGQPNRSSMSAVICKTNMDDSHGPIIKIVTSKFLEDHYNAYGCVRIIGIAAP